VGTNLDHKRRAFFVPISQRLSVITSSDAPKTHFPSKTDLQPNSLPKTSFPY
jgi:hypothetical protein